MEKIEDIDRAATEYQCKNPCKSSFSFPLFLIPAYSASLLQGLSEPVGSAVIHHPWLPHGRAGSEMACAGSQVKDTVMA